MNNYEQIIKLVQPKEWMCDFEKNLGCSILSNDAYLKITNDKEFVYEYPNIMDYIHPIGEIVNLENGDQYVGEVDKNGQFQGHGTYFWKNGDVYHGEWQYGNFWGKGVMFLDVNKSNERCYIGHYLNGKCSGYGKYYMKNGEMWYGDFMNDELLAGKWTNLIGDSYVGKFKNFKFDGDNGLYRWHTGERYLGGWGNGKMNGKGTMWDKDGKSYSGIWKDNVFQQ